MNYSTSRGAEVRAWEGSGVGYGMGHHGFAHMSLHATILSTAACHTVDRTLSLQKAPSKLQSKGKKHPSDLQDQRVIV